MSRTDKLLDLRKLKTRRKRETNSKAIESASLEGGVCCGDRTEGRGRRTGLGLWMRRSGSPPTHTHPRRHHVSEELQEADRLILQSGRERSRQRGGKRIGPRLTRKKGGWGLQRKGRLGATDGVRGGAAQGKGVRGLERAKGLWLLL